MQTKIKPKSVCARIGIASLALFLLWYGGILLMLKILANVEFSLNGINRMWLVYLINDIPLYLFALPVFLLILKTIPNGADPERQTLKLTPKSFIILLLVSQGLCYAASYASTFILGFMEILAPSFNPYENIELIANSSNTLPNLVFTVLVAPIGEEFIFRYSIHKKLRGASDKTYIMLSGLLFGFFHASYSQIFYAVALGMVLAWVYAQTRKFIYPVLIHMFINLLGSVIMPLVLQNVNLDINGMLSSALEFDIEGMLSSLDASFFIMVFLSIFMLGLMVFSLIYVAMHKRNIALSLRPPAEAGWPYNPPKSHLINRKKLPTNAASTKANPNDPNWKMPEPIDVVPRKKSPYADYSNAIESYRGFQETAQAQANYDYLSGVPYSGPEGETLENVPVKGWFKTCLLNYGMILYFGFITAFMVWSVIETIIA